MSARCIVFVEEPSAGIVVESLAERLGVRSHIQIVEHAGKKDLGSSYPRKIAAWRHPRDARFIVLHDNDGGACDRLKAQLMSAIAEPFRTRTRIRIVMQSLEAWYLGDFAALAAAELVKPRDAEAMSRKRAFDDPELLLDPKKQFMRLHGEVGQIMLARRIAPHLDPARNRARSFRLLAETLAAWSRS